jgi:hypothetical protein
LALLQSQDSEILQCSKGRFAAWGSPRPLDEAQRARANDHPTTAARTLAPRQSLLAVKTPDAPPTSGECDPDDQSRADCEIKISHLTAKIKDLRADNA